MEDNPKVKIITKAKEMLKNKKLLIIIGVAVLVIVGGTIAKREYNKYKAKKALEDALANLHQTITTNPMDYINGTVTNNDDKNNSSGVISDDTSANKDNNKDEEAPKVYAEVKAGQKVTIEDYLEYSFVKSGFANKIKPSKPDSYYHYFEAKASDCTLAYVKVKIKNLEVDEFDGDQIPTATLVYMDKYKYDCSLIVEEDDGSDLSSYSSDKDIKPLKNKTFYYYAEVPNEIKTDENSLVFRIELQDNAYEYKIK